MQISKPKRKKSGGNDTATSPDTPSKNTAARGETVRLNVNVPKEMYRQLRIKAAEKDTSVSRAVIGLIENYVTRQ